MAEDAFESDDLINTIFAQPGSTDHAARPDFSRKVNSFTSEPAYGGYKPEGECLPSGNQQLSNRETNTNTETSNDDLLNSQDDAARLIEEWDAWLQAATSTAQPADVIVTTSPKTGRYKVKDFTVSTERTRPVNFKLLRARPGVQLFMSYTYQGHIYGDKPVKRCKEHNECTWCEGHQFNEGFCVISKFHHCKLDDKGNPMVVLTPQEEHLDADGSVEFSAVFACWNSCDPDKLGEKDMTLHIWIMQDGKILKKVEYDIEVWAALGRDAFKHMKRKLTAKSENSQEEESPKKKVKKGVEERSNKVESEEAGTSAPVSLLPCAGDEESCCLGNTSKASNSSSKDISCPPPSPPASPTSIKNEKLMDIFVMEGLDEETRDLVKRLVKIKGVTLYSQFQMMMQPSLIAPYNRMIEGVHQFMEKVVGSVATDPSYKTD